MDILKKIKRLKTQTEETLLDAFSVVRSVEDRAEVKTWCQWIRKEPRKSLRPPCTTSPIKPISLRPCGATSMPIMFAEFISEYGTTILYTIITALAGYLGIVLKNLYTKYINDKTKQTVVKTVVQGVEQMYKDLHGEEKLNAALENASEMLALKGIEISEFELKLLIEAAVAEFNDAFHKEKEVTENEAN